MSGSSAPFPEATTTAVAERKEVAGSDGDPGYGFDPAARGAILAKVLNASPILVGIFSKQSLRALYINETGRAWLDPSGETVVGELSMPDIIGVGSMDRFQHEMLLQAGVFGQWMGACTLRDAWGSEIPVQASLTMHAGGAPGEGELMCLQAARFTGTQPSGGTSDRELVYALLETLPDSVYFKDLQSRFIRVSRAMAQKDGRKDPSNLIGLTDFDRFTAERARVAYEDEQTIIRTGQPLIDREEKNTWPDGRVQWVSTTKLPLRDSEGRIVGTYGISRDITARKKAEEEAREIQTKVGLSLKLESIGRLAAGIAHEVNTPTQFITDNTHFLTQAFAGLESVIRVQRDLRVAAAGFPAIAAQVKAAEAAEEAAETGFYLGEVPIALKQNLDGLGRIARIVRSLKEFSHPNSAECTPVDIGRVIETAMTISRHEWKYVAEVVTEFDASLPPVPCIVDEFNQVILNLIINAAHAIESALKVQGQAGGRGRITLRTRSDGGDAVVEVEDTGTGIPPEIRGRIFDPFFTTKDLGKGSGQGLAIVHTVIVKHHRGSVDFTSEVGRGTCFRLRLPLKRSDDPTAK